MAKMLEIFHNITRNDKYESRMPPNFVCHSQGSLILIVTILTELMRGITFEKKAFHLFKLRLFNRFEYKNIIISDIFLIGFS